MNDATWSAPGAGEASYPTARDYVAGRRPEIAIEAGKQLTTGFVPQTHATGAGAEVCHAAFCVVCRRVKTKTQLLTQGGTDRRHLVNQDVRVLVGATSIRAVQRPRGCSPREGDLRLEYLVVVGRAVHRQLARLTSGHALCTRRQDAHPIGPGLICHSDAGSAIRLLGGHRTPRRRRWSRLSGPSAMPTLTRWRDNPRAVQDQAVQATRTLAHR